MRVTVGSAASIRERGAVVSLGSARTVVAATAGTEGKAGDQRGGAPHVETSAQPPGVHDSPFWQHCP